MRSYSSDDTCNGLSHLPIFVKCSCPDFLQDVFQNLRSGCPWKGDFKSRLSGDQIRSVMSNIINCHISWNHIKLYIRYRPQAGHSLHLPFLFILHYYTLLVTDLFPGFRMTSTIPGALSKDVFRFFFHPEAQPGCRCSKSFLLS